MTRIGLLTGGGDAPGLNGIIEAVSKTLLKKGIEVIGICDGFEGILEGRTKTISLESIEGLHAEAGTFLGTSNKSRIEDRRDDFLRGYGKLNLQGLVVAGGDGTFKALSKLNAPIQVVGVPKTIDNDLPGTEITFGYDTACSVVCDSIDALRATANAHSRIMIVETMGRTAGWIALGGGLAAQADVILIPERPFEKRALIDFLKAKRKAGARGLVMSVSECASAAGESAEVAFRVSGSPQEERYGGVAQKMARWIEAEIPEWEARHTVLGHLQRSRAPTTTDRFLTLSMGVRAAQLVSEGRFGQAVVYRDGAVTTCPLPEVQGAARVVPKDHRWVQLAQALEIFI
jgi:6-phosphofructokinase 1